MSPRTPDTYTDRLANLRNVSPSAIRKRRERGWTDEIAEGKRHPAPVALHPSYPAPPRHHSAEYETPARLQPPMRRAAVIMFERNRAYVERHREEFGEEPCWDDFETVQRECAKFGIKVTRKKF
jgi:hypothetical protein